MYVCNVIISLCHLSFFLFLQHNMFLQLDSVHATKNQNTVSWALSQPITNKTQIHFRSFEYAVGINNVRQISGMNHLQLCLDSTLLVNLYIPEKNYTTITQLLTALNAQLAASSIVATVNADNKIVLTQTQTGIGFSVVPTNFAYHVLGFRGVAQVGPSAYTSPYTVALPNLVCTGTSPFNLSVDTYVNLYMPNLQSTSDTVVSSLAVNRTHFKIPLSSVNGQVYFFTSQQFKQTVHIDPTLVLTEMRIQMTDRFGSLFSNAGCGDFDWSLLLEVN